MEFTLYYRGNLKTKRDLNEKQEIRRYFHSQLKNLWQQKPLAERYKLIEQALGKGDIGIIKAIGGFSFAPLVTEQLNLIAELKITLLRPEPPGSIFTQTGDIDNRLKTLFDALKTPKNSNEIPPNDSPSAEERPFFCLLEDDHLITKVQVETDRLLVENEGKSEVVLLVHVTTKATRINFGNIGLL